MSGHMGSFSLHGHMGDMTEPELSAAGPANGYVTEDGLIFYVAEDGTTFYVQE